MAGALSAAFVPEQGHSTACNSVHGMVKRCTRATTRHTHANTAGTALCTYVVQHAKRIRGGQHQLGNLEAGGMYGLLELGGLLARVLCLLQPLQSLLFVGHLEVGLLSPKSGHSR